MGVVCTSLFSTVGTSCNVNQTWVANYQIPKLRSWSRFGLLTTCVICDCIQFRYDAMNYVIEDLTHVPNRVLKSVSQKTPYLGL